MLGIGLFPARCSTRGTATYPLAVASYNAGAGNVRKWVNALWRPAPRQVDIIRWIEHIPFTETRGYVQRVLENSVVYDRHQPGDAGDARSMSRTYLGKIAPGLMSRTADRPPLHHARRASRGSAPNMTTCSAIERPKLVETIAWAAAQWRPLREWRLYLRPQAAARDRPAARLPVAR